MSTDKGKEPASDTPVTTTTISSGHNNNCAIYIQLRHCPGGAAFDAMGQPRAPLSLVSPAWLKRTHPKTTHYDSKQTKYTSHVQLDICIPVRQAQSKPGSAHGSFVNLKQIFYVEGRLNVDLLLGGDFITRNQVLIDMDVPSVQFPDQDAISDARVFELPDHLAKPVEREARRVRFARLNPSASAPSPVHEPVPDRAPGSGILKKAPTFTQPPASSAMKIAPPLTDAMRAALTSGAVGGDSPKGPAFEFPPHKEGEDRPNPLGSRPGPALNGGMSWPQPPRPNPALEPWIPTDYASDITSTSSDGSSSDDSFPAPQGKTLYSLANRPLTIIRSPSPPIGLGDAGISLPTHVRFTSDSALTHRKSAFTAPRPAPNAPTRKAFVNRGKVVMLTDDARDESTNESHRDTLYEITEGAKGKPPMAPKAPKRDVEPDNGRKHETVINPHSKLDPTLAAKVGAEEDLAKRISKKF